MKSSYVKNPLRSSAIGNDDKFCFLWSRMAKLHPCNNKHPNRVSNYRQYYNEINFEGFGLTNGFKCSDVHKVEKITNLCINMFEVNFYQHQEKWKQKLTPT